MSKCVLSFGSPLPNWSQHSHRRWGQKSKWGQCVSWWLVDLGWWAKPFNMWCSRKVGNWRGKSGSSSLLRTLILCKLLQSFSNNNGNCWIKTSLAIELFCCCQTCFVSACQSTSPLLPPHALHILLYALRWGVVCLFMSFFYAWCLLKETSFNCKAITAKSN